MNIIREREIIGVYKRINSGAEERGLEAELIDHIKKKKMLDEKLEEVEAENYKLMEDADVDDRVDELLSKVREISRVVEEKGKADHMNLLYRSKIQSLENMSKRRLQY